MKKPGDSTVGLGPQGSHPSPDSGAFSEVDATSPGLAMNVADAIPTLKSFGPYQLVQKLGEGGMGQVWLAEQTSPVQRKVAIKLIKAGMFDDSVLRRFETERQSLAIMDHPAIAKVFDAGATPGGQPYFVMEYVPGLPITAYCDKKKLNIRDRLELFIRACEGVQHAHQKALIHRDLKPANLLVVEVDGKPQPRIIDFGLAKSLAPYHGGDPGHTRLGAFVGTPGYMSPEQADPDVQDVDTRTDVYSLGVILYELLIGSLPFDATQWQKLRLDELLRHLREDDPLRPSTKVSGDRKSSPILAADRGTEPQQLASLLRGDLDWITMKALEKDRARRYDSPSALAADIKRYLNDQPVLATPPSVSYRASKFIRRHRIAVAAAAAISLMLIVLAVSMTIQTIRIARERDRANREAATAKRVSDFLSNLFSSADPFKSSGAQISVRQMLDQGAKQVQFELKDEPAVKARLLRTIANAYVGLGLYPQAEPLIRQAVSISESALGPNNPQTIDCLDALANVLYQLNNYKEMETVALSVRDRSRAVYPPHSLDAAHYERELATVYEVTGRLEQAEKLDQEILATFEKSAGPLDPETIQILSNVAQDEYSLQHTTKALALAKEVVERYTRAFGPDHAETMRAENRLAARLNAAGHADESVPLLQQLIEKESRVFGPEHPETFKSKYNLAIAFQDARQPQQAEAVLVALLEQEQRIFGADNLNTLDTLLELARVYANGNRPAKALPILATLYERAKRTLPLGHGMRTVTTNEYAHCLKALARYPEAEALLRPSVNALRAGHYLEDADAEEDLLATTIMHEGKFAEAKSIEDRLISSQLSRSHDPGDESLLIFHYNEACLAALSGNKDESFLHLQYVLDRGSYLLGGAAQDPDLKSLRTDPRFQSLLEKLKQNSAKP